MSLAKIPSRTDYVDEVYKTLLDAISAGKLAPGEKGLGRAPCFGMNVRFHERKRTLSNPLRIASGQIGNF